MPPPFPSSHRGMTKNPVRPTRYRPGKAVAEEHSSEEEEEEEEDDEREARREQERRRRAEALRRAKAPKASSFPASALAAQKVEEDDDEEGFVTEDEEDDKSAPAPAPKAVPHPTTDDIKPTVSTTAPESDEEEEEEEEGEEEESSEEESSSEDEAPRRMLIRPTFIKKDKRNTAASAAGQTQAQADAERAAEAETQRAAQRQEKADQLIRDQLEKEAIARSSANRAWDYDELVEAEDEEAIDDTDGLDPEAERAAWTLRELKRVQRSREAIEASEKELEEIERRRNLTAEEREREDSEFIAKQKEDRDATRGQTGFMQRYFHKGAFFRGDLEAEGLDRRELMGARFEDDVNRDTLPQYMQVRDMTKLGKKGRTRYRDLKTEDTGRFGDGLENRRRRDGPPEGVTDERFMPDRRGGGDDGDRGPTGANASVVRPRRRSRSRSPKRERRDDRDSGRFERSRSRERRKRSPSPYDDREKRRRVDSS
ncbi:Micro-fibrillar-associated protein 1 C-terminal [Penicillium samsonianum]|uniref:Micro-fibrillar-associated protein 1 C-terminal n=1 Tax=Penicillium samsonianum TaxID=1882272 RepID=UPI0025491DED|nr:Micro-fibrillar-associated protein 1 C-terminal [Penicillium samsonianum]KAJ6139809.1 Micro-fibrillar-associated protein 1 C-terminal [Penicillium samsonianum]